MLTVIQPRSVLIVLILRCTLKVLVIFNPEMGQKGTNPAPGHAERNNRNPIEIITVVSIEIPL